MFLGMAVVLRTVFGSRAVKTTIRLSRRKPTEGSAEAAPRAARRGQCSTTVTGAAALGRYAIPRAFVVFLAAQMLMACGTSGAGRNRYRADAAPGPAATGVPGFAVDTPDVARSSPGASGPNSAALNLRLMEKVGPAGIEGDLSVGPGDLIEISVFEVEELSKLRLRIPARGVISVPLVGHIHAAGRTATELEDEVRTRLQQKFMHNPQVAVFVHEHNSQRVTVIGAVRRGGIVTLNRQLRLADALATAEGLADDADHIVYVVRRVPAGTLNQIGAAPVSPNGGTAPPSAASPPAGDAKSTEEATIAIDLLELTNGRDELNIPLKPGDVIHVPRAGSFYVGGSVEHAGSFLLKGKTTLQQAILAAGGVNAVADWTDVRLYRRTPSGQVEVKTVDLNAVEEGQPAPELQRNDVVIVGKHGGKAFLYGFLDFFKGALSVGKGI
jgi:polysaccharide export outer membrane protein